MAATRAKTERIDIRLTVPRSPASSEVHPSARLAIRKDTGTRQCRVRYSSVCRCAGNSQRPFPVVERNVPGSRRSWSVGWRQRAATRSKESSQPRAVARTRLTKGFVVVTQRWWIGRNAVVRLPAEYGYVAQLGCGHPCAVARKKLTMATRGVAGDAEETCRTWSAEWSPSAATQRKVSARSCAVARKRFATAIRRGVGTVPGCRGTAKADM